RVCGEEKICFHSITGSREIPPRVRRRGRFVLSPGLIFGNTSACAEKRRHTRAIATAPGKYLRVCGEEGGSYLAQGRFLEIPPRVRRRGAIPEPLPPLQGNTSACAEKRLDYR